MRDFQEVSILRDNIRRNFTVVRSTTKMTEDPVANVYRTHVIIAAHRCFYPCGQPQYCSPENTIHCHYKTDTCMALSQCKVFRLKRGIPKTITHVNKATQHQANQREEKKNVLHSLKVEVAARVQLIESYKIQKSEPRQEEAQ